MFRKKSKEKITKMDVLITSVVLWTIVAWAFGLKKRSQKDPSLPGQSWWKNILRRFIWR